MGREAERARARASVLAVLEQRHGVGGRGGHVPAWILARVDSALDALCPSSGDGLGLAAQKLCEDGAELERLAELLRVGETHFYRDAVAWDALRAALLPSFAGRDRVRAVSAGCSTGEEAWTLAMLVAEACAASRRQPAWRVVGMDRSEVALATAREGAYSSEAARHLPADLRARYLSQEGDGVRMVDALRDRVSFVVRDLLQGPPPGSYELVICKNVLIYLGEQAGRRAVDGLRRSLAPGGALIVARSEVPRLRAMGHSGEEIAPGVTVFRG